ncbi:MAG: hypothetical protein AAGH79_05645 [Bacteroidota bacterium]
MPNFHWTFIEEKGKTHKVGLFHGKNTGHVLIHCNGQILKIDFNVYESKTYSFFINEELIELELDKKGDTFYYRFHINKEADTPRNKIRKERERHHFLQTLLFFGAFALFVTLGVWFFIRLDQSQQQAQLSVNLQGNGERTVGFVQLAIEPGDTILEYEYVAEGRLLRYELEPGQYPASLILKSGWPLQNQDEFTVVYKPDRPQIHQLLWGEPTEKQIQRYVEQAKAKHRAANPDKHPAMARCEVDVVFSRFGLEGLLHILYQEKPSSLSSIYNRMSYERLMRNPAIKQEVEKNCWD